MAGRSLTVLNVAYPFAPVGPDAVGGAEQILTRIDEALVQAGHRSLVIASAGSSVRGELIHVPSTSQRISASTIEAGHTATLRAILTTLDRYPVDVIHFHGHRFDLHMPPPSIPLLITLHLPAYLYARAAFQIERPNTFVHCVSVSQQAALPPTKVPVLSPIPNGVPTDSSQPVYTAATYAVALGRICPEKGFHLAAQAARRARLPLILGGHVFPYSTHLEYFDHMLSPLLDGRRFKFVGPLRKIQKEILLRNARCLLVPSQVPETSSLVAMEAAAVGTPVVAFRAGALPEIVENGRTGLLVDSVEQMAHAICQVDQVDRRECRAIARQRFSANAMTARYLTQYAELAAISSPIRHVRDAADDARIAISEVTSVAGMQAMHDEWSALWHRSGDSIFQHPDWLIPWCRPFNVSQPWLLRLSLGDRLVGVVPLLIYMRGSERVLTLLGAGISDDQDVLLEPEHREAALCALWHYLAEHRSRWDVLELENLRESSPLLGAVADGWECNKPAQTDVRPTLILAAEVQSLDDLHARGLVKDLRYCARRAEREHMPAVFEDVDEHNFDRLFAALIRLHRMRWNARGESGMVTPDLEAFHREAAQRLLQDGLLRLHLLSLRGRPAAASYGYFAAGRSVFYLGGFDEELARFSPGKLVLAHAIEYAIAHDRAHAYDFLRGAESYKYAWGAIDQPLYRRVLRLTPEST